MIEKILFWLLYHTGLRSKVFIADRPLQMKDRIVFVEYLAGRAYIARMPKRKERDVTMEGTNG